MILEKRSEVRHSKESVCSSLKPGLQNGYPTLSDDGIKISGGGVSTNQ
jgi:hypothetical protein